MALVQASSAAAKGLHIARSKKVKIGIGTKKNILPQITLNLNQV